MFTTAVYETETFDTDSYMGTVKIRLRELMREKTIRDGRHPEYEQITQQEVAKAIGVAQGTLGSWARNTVEKLDRVMLFKLCKYFECHIEELLVLED